MSMINGKNNPAGRKLKPYEPTQSDDLFLRIVKAFGIITTRSYPTTKELVDVLGYVNYNFIKKWKYRLGHLPRVLPYGDMTQQSAMEHMKAIAKDIIKLDDSYHKPMTDDSEYLNPNSGPKFTKDPVRETPVDGIFDYEHELTDEDLKNFKPFPGSE